MLKFQVIFRYLTIRLLRLLLLYASLLVLLLVLLSVYYFFIDSSISTLVFLGALAKVSVLYVPMLFLVIFLVYELGYFVLNKSLAVDRMLNYSSIHLSDTVKNLFELYKNKTNELAVSATLQKESTVINAQSTARTTFVYLRIFIIQFLISSFLLVILGFYVGSSKLIDFSSKLVSLEKDYSIQIVVSEVFVDEDKNLSVSFAGKIPDFYGKDIIIEYAGAIQVSEKKDFFGKSITLGKLNAQNFITLNFENKESLILELNILEFDILNLKYIVQYPDYLQRTDTLEAVNGESILKGSTLSLLFKGKNTSLKAFSINDEFSKNNHFKLDNVGVNEMFLKFQNPYFESVNEYFFYVTEDNPSILNIQHSLFNDSINIDIVANDDFGISEINVFINNQLYQTRKLADNVKKHEESFKLPNNRMIEDIQIEIKDEAGNVTTERIEINKEKESENKNKDLKSSDKNESLSELKKLQNELKIENDSKEKLNDALELYKLSKSVNKEKDLLSNLKDIKNQIKNDASILKDLNDLIKDLEDNVKSGDKRKDGLSKMEEQKLQEKIEKLQSKMSKYRKRKDTSKEGSSGSIDIAAEQANIELILLMANTLSHKAEKDENILLAEKLLYLTLKDSVSNFAKRNQELSQTLLESALELDRKFNKLPAVNQGIFYDLNNISSVFYDILKNKSEKEKNKEKKDDEKEGDGNCEKEGGGKPKKSDLLSNKPEGEEPGEGGEGEKGKKGDSENGDESEGKGDEGSMPNGIKQSNDMNEIEELLKSILSNQGKQTLSTEELEERRKLLKSLKGRETSELKKELITKLQISQKGIKQEEEYEQRKAETYLKNRGLLNNNEKNQLEGIKFENTFLKRNPLILK